ncbi:multidrug and toxin extrusion protein 1 isoform X1 [Labeo rohita]|uniref:multidrug and toxin extrusion protein 1 isoform X1 n=2 Tax=Labeo rohita TaxID=84645 RepID=UPI0021E248A3|nr:multidrug and toxin extrusion protein 1 isoform X1 [Labeo rohita]XP_050985256.1 multidrug and toxin extrusion protein 1 isoform X1 [Labeo rohita]
MSEPENTSRCQACLRCFLPVHFTREIVNLCSLALPVFLSYLFDYLIIFVSTVFCGHLGKVELDGVTLATAAINVMGICIGYGLSAACDTLISQAFGAGNLHLVGVITQKAVLILLLACLPCCALLINTESVLLLVGQSPEVARVSQLYVDIFLPGLPAAFMFIIEAKYLQNQGKTWPLVITGVVANVLNALINYIFLFVLDMGVTGSAAANTISQYSLAIILLIYIRCTGLHKDTWPGWSMDCLQEWDSFIHLALPSMLMMCAEWWTYEIGGLLAGLIGEVELGAQSVMYSLANIAYMIPIGFSVAGNVRVGNAMGAGDVAQAKLSAKLSIICAVSVAVVLAIIVGSSKNVIAYIFTNDKDIRMRVATVMVLFAPFHLLDSTAAAGGSIVKGLGKQKIGAVCNLVGFVLVGFPIGISLMFAAKWGVFGLWTGLLISVFLQSVFLIALLFKLNWQKASVEAQIRAGVLTRGTDDGAQEDGGNTEGRDLDMATDMDGLLDEQADVLLATVRVQLPLSALVLRRGLVVAAMLALLAAGLAVRFFLKR